MIEASTLAPELELLILAARTEVEGETARRIEELAAKPLDWRYLTRAAVGHGSLPLLYRSLLNICPESVPELHMTTMRERNEANIQRNLFLTGQLLKILNGFSSIGISALPFKGPVLAATAYGDLSLRQFSDLDILVRRRDALKARAFLLADGYQPRTDIPEGHQLARVIETHHQLGLVSPDRKVVVEVQWGITPRFFSFPFDEDTLWGRAEVVSVGGKRVQSISPEDMLLLLCVHGSKHCWERLAWICDLAELVKARDDLDWARVRGQARATGAQRMLYLGLALARDLLDARLPREISEGIENDAAIEPLAADVVKRLPLRSRSTRGLMSYVLFHLRSRERLRDRLRYISGRLTTTTGKDTSLMPLPEFLSPFRLPLRAIRLAIRGGVELLGRSHTS